MKLPILAFVFLHCSLILTKLQLSFITVWQCPKFCPNTFHVTVMRLKAFLPQRITSIEMIAQGLCFCFFFSVFFHYISQGALVSYSFKLFDLLLVSLLISCFSLYYHGLEHGLSHNWPYCCNAFSPMYPFHPETLLCLFPSFITCVCRFRCKQCWGKMYESWLPEPSDSLSPGWKKTCTLIDAYYLLRTRLLEILLHRLAPAF